LLAFCYVVLAKALGRALIQNRQKGRTAANRSCLLTIWVVEGG